LLLLFAVVVGAGSGRGCLSFRLKIPTGLSLSSEEVVGVILTVFYA
jgi:hypothetical protein